MARPNPVRLHPIDTSSTVTRTGKESYRYGMLSAVRTHTVETTDGTVTLDKVSWRITITGRTTRQRRPTPALEALLEEARSIAIDAAP